MPRFIRSFLEQIKKTYCPSTAMKVFKATLP